MKYQRLCKKKIKINFLFSEGETGTYDEEANKEYWKKYYEYYYGQKQPETESAQSDVKQGESDAKKGKKAQKRKTDQNHGIYILTGKPMSKCAKSILRGTIQLLNYSK